MLFDFPGGTRQPHPARFIVAMVVSVVLSLVACALLALLGTTVFPSTIHYAHFAFADYAKLTVIGVVLASLAWPAMTLVSSRASRPFLLLTILVTVVGLAPDFWILFRGAPADAVFVLSLMHIALALITYPALVFIAPQRLSATAPSVTVRRRRSADAEADS